MMAIALYKGWDCLEQEDLRQPLPKSNSRAYSESSRMYVMIAVNPSANVQLRFNLNLGIRARTGACDLLL